MENGQIANTFFNHLCKMTEWDGRYHLHADKEKSILSYRVDWYDPDNELIIEWDDPSHQQKTEYDKARRNQIIEETGFQFIEINEITRTCHGYNIKNQDILNTVSSILQNYKFERKVKQYPQNKFVDIKLRAEYRDILKEYCKKTGDKMYVVVERLIDIHLKSNEEYDYVGSRNILRVK